VNLPRPARVRFDRAWIGPLLLLAVVVLVLAACAPATGSPGASGSHAPTPVPTPLEPAKPGGDPISLVSWLFTPVFQALFILLVLLDDLTGNIAIAIVLMTLVIRALLIPLFRTQTVSQRRMQLVQPELKEIQRRYKGDRAKISEAQMALYKERGVNPAAGCLPLVLQFILLIPMYSVIRDGLTNYDPTAMVTVFGHELPILHCQNLVNGVPTPPQPCLDAVAFGINWGVPDILFSVAGIGISLIAIFSALLQVVQSRMVMPPAAEGQQDQSAAIQRQTMLLFPFITIFYGGFLPAGLFLYWIVTTVFSIIQQYLIVGYGSLFPLFGWMPAFAKGHTPRFPIAVPAPTDTGPKTSVQAGRTSPTGSPTTTKDRAASAAATVRPSQRGRQGRRGRRR
jgi:YidC/Oxa1 family membrane protein insertase